MSNQSDGTVTALHAEALTRRRVLRWWHVPFGLLLLAVACVLVLRWHWRREFRKRIEAIAASGYPMTPAELDAWYPVPAGANAAHYIGEAANWYVELPSDDAQSLRQLFSTVGQNPPPTEPLPPDVTDALVRHVQANARAIEILQEGAAIEESRWPVDLSDGLASLVPHLPWVRELCFLLCSKAILCAEAEDTAGATETIETAFSLTRSLRMEPVPLSQLMRGATNTAIVRAVERLLCRATPTDSELSRLQAVVSAADDPDALLRGLVGDRCFRLVLFSEPQIARQHLADLPPPGVLEVYSGLGLAAREGAVYLDLMAEFIEAMESPAYRRYEISQLVDEAFRHWHAGIILSAGDFTIGSVVARDILTLAHLRSTLAALSAERYQRAHGCWPKTLTDVAPQFLDRVPDDPFDGQPLRYKRFDNGFAVYSVAEDRGDDGGKKRTPLSQRAGETCDIVFAVERLVRVEVKSPEPGRDGKGPEAIERFPGENQ